MTVENAQNQSPIPYAISHRGSFKDRLDQLQTLLEHTLKLAQKEDPDDDLTVKQINTRRISQNSNRPNPSCDSFATVNHRTKPSLRLIIFEKLRCQSKYFAWRRSMQIYLAKCCNVNGEGFLRIAIGDWTEPDKANVKRKIDMRTI
jgi:hypothetical protein